MPILAKECNLATTVVRARSRESFFQKIKNVIFSNQVLPFVLTFAVLGVLFVLFRMKGIEIDYKISSLNKDIDQTILVGKELKAKKAKMMSVKRLRSLASEHGLSQAKQSQIIVIPE